MTKNNDSRMHAESQAFEGFLIFMRAVSCARFSPIESSIVNMVMELSWFRPRFVMGRKKQTPVELSATRLAPMLGFDRSCIQMAIKALRQGSILLVREGGRFVLNPRWLDWMNKDGQIRILASCHDYIRRGVPVDHICAPYPGTDLEQTETQPVALVDDAQVVVADPQQPVADPQQPVASRQQLPEVEAPRPVADPPQSIDHRGTQPVPLNGVMPSAVANRQQTVAIPPQELPTGNSPYCDTGADPREDKSLSDSACTEFKSNLRDNNLSISSVQAPNKPALMDSPGNAKCNHGDNPGTNLECTQSRERYINPSIPSSSSDLEPFENPPACPVATMPSPQASMHPTALEGDKVPDMPTLDRAIKLSDRHFSTPYPINDGILRFRYVYDSAWILKAIRRTILLNVNPRKFGYVHSILQGWFAVGRPDVGIEDGYDDDLRPLASKPFVPVQATAGNQNGYSAAPKNFVNPFKSEEEKIAWCKRAAADMAAMQAKRMQAAMAG